MPKDLVVLIKRRIRYMCDFLGGCSCDSLLMFFLLLVVLFDSIGIWGDDPGTLLFFFLLLIILFAY